MSSIYPYDDYPRKTWDIKLGYEDECIDCPIKVEVVSGSTSGGGDLSGVESRLDTLIDNSNVLNLAVNQILNAVLSGNTITNDILSLLNTPVTQTVLTTTSDGNIPAGVQSYTIINLGTNPTDPNPTFNSFQINGITIVGRIGSLTNSAGSVKTLSAPTTYTTNGNTLLIIYNS